VVALEQYENLDDLGDVVSTCGWHRIAVCAVVVVSGALHCSSCYYRSRRGERHGWGRYWGPQRTKWPPIPGTKGAKISGKQTQDVAPQSILGGGATCDRSHGLDPPGSEPDGYWRIIDCTVKYHGF